MSATAATATDLPGEGFFSRAARKAKAMANSAWRGTIKALQWTGRMLKRGTVATAKGAGYVVGGVGWTVSGVAKVALAVVGAVLGIVAVVAFVIIAVVFALVSALVWLITMALMGLRFIINFVWDGSNWLVRGRPVSWKRYRNTKQASRVVDGESRLDKVLSRLGIYETDKDEIVVPADVTADDIVRLRVFDEDKSLVEEKFFPNPAKAHEYADEQYHEAVVTAEVTPFNDVIEEFATESFTALPDEEKVIKADEIARALLTERLLGTEGENIDRLRQIMDEEVAVPTPSEVAAEVYSTSEQPEGWAAPLTEADFAKMANPREVDWTEFLMHDAVPKAYQYFLNRAIEARDKREASYWSARLWMRMHRPREMAAWTNPAKMFALYRSNIDKANTVLGQARQGVYDECQTLAEANNVLQRQLDEQDLADAEARSETAQS